MASTFFSKVLARLFIFKKDLKYQFIPGTNIPILNNESGEIAPTPEAVQSLDTVYACARLIAEQISTLPIKVAKVGAVKQYRPNHPLQRAIDNPIYYLNKNSYIQKAIYHLLLWGNHYAELITDGRGDTIGYNIVHPAYVEIKDNNGIVYVVDEGEDSKRVVQWDRMVHVTLPGDDQILGTSIVGRAKRDLANALYVRRYSTGFFKNGGKPNNVVTIEENITPEQAQEWQQMYNQRYGAGGTAFLGGGAKIHNLSFPPNDSQFLETKMFGVETIARWFNIDPPLIGHLKDGTLSNFETVWRNFAKKTLLPITEQIETEYSRKAFRQSQYENGYRYEFDYTKLTKGSPNEEAELLRTYIQNGVMTPNEARQRIGLNPVEGGDDTFMQSATIPIRLIEEQVNGSNSQDFPAGDSDGE